MSVRRNLNFQKTTLRRFNRSHTSMRAPRRKAQARKIVAHLQDLSKGQYVSAFEIATALAALGDRDNAFVWFEKAYRARESQLPFLNVVPRLNALRSDPRFQDLLRRVGLVSGNTRGDSSKP